jgi:hypothetical protein
MLITTVIRQAFPEPRGFAALMLVTGGRGHAGRPGAAGRERLAGDCAWDRVACPGASEAEPVRIRCAIRADLRMIDWTAIESYRSCAVANSWTSILFALLKPAQGLYGFAYGGDRALDREQVELERIRPPIALRGTARRAVRSSSDSRKLSSDASCQPSTQLIASGAVSGYAAQAEAARPDRPPAGLGAGRTQVELGGAPCPAPVERLAWWRDGADDRSGRCVLCAARPPAVSGCCSPCWPA